MAVSRFFSSTNPTSSQSICVTALILSAMEPFGISSDIALSLMCTPSLLDCRLRQAVTVRMVYGNRIDSGDAAHGAAANAAGLHQGTNAGAGLEYRSNSTRRPDENSAKRVVWQATTDTIGPSRGISESLTELEPVEYRLRG
ncbi:hypothetical protein F5Y06DRAFT_298767 [Hypoxylon sp. FL0890]|nr:hypothetical protein F5Y06DRAFT_298767 [Hypoxylon sp. FL0890]